MRRTMLVAVALTLGAAPAWSQGPDTARPAREEMRRRLDEHFTARVREELGLDERQTARLRETATTFGGRRRELETRERTVRSALESQLRPGIAADRDSVARLTDALVEMRTAYAQTFRDEHKEISKFLDPVQRARLYMMRERLMRRVHEVRDERMGEGRMGREFHGRRRPYPTRQPGDSV
ncbi:MAG TPA: Spy/CpxP family protein refolding chaperone [Gemmatimonadales bacterium]|nr:Spy/CpxP family protein refolding chaperone [Gemmatimonadales bacterium]